MTIIEKGNLENYEKAEGGHGKVIVDLIEDEDVFDYPSYFPGFPSRFEMLSSDNVTVTSITADFIQGKVPYVIKGAWNKVPWNFSEWQKSQLKGLDTRGATCLLKSWLIGETELPPGPYCNASWDNTFCWSPTPKGTTLLPSCTEIWEGLGIKDFTFDETEGYASRVCRENGTWDWANYTECAKSYSNYMNMKEQQKDVILMLHYFLCVVPLLSLICLGVALLVFWYFRRCIWCDRVTIHTQLMIALMIRSTMLVIIPHLFLLKKYQLYPKVDLVCKVVLSVDLYAAVAAINWLFLQGVYLNGRWVINIFNSQAPFKTYFAVGWILPMALVIGISLFLQMCGWLTCRLPESEFDETYLLILPVFLALSANLVFLCNIMQVLYTQRRTWEISDKMLIRRAFKSTFFMFPFLGLNNLIFFANPAGKWNRILMICHSICGSSQGVYAAFLFCFTTREVRSAIYLEYCRLRDERMIHFRWPAFFQAKVDSRGNRYEQVRQQQQQRRPSLNLLNTVVQQVSMDTCDIEIRIHSPPPTYSPRHVIADPFPTLPTILEEYVTPISPATMTTITASEDEELDNVEEVKMGEEYQDSFGGEAGGASRLDQIDLSKKVVKETML